MPTQKSSQLVTVLLQELADLRQRTATLAGPDVASFRIADTTTCTFHTLKGALGGVCSRAGMSAAFELEQAGKSDDPAAIYCAYQCLENVLDQLVPLLSALLPQDGDADEASDATP